jgi:hypothetical protein
MHKIEEDGKQKIPIPHWDEDYLKSLPRYHPASCKSQALSQERPGNPTYPASLLTGDEPRLPYSPGMENPAFS